MTRSILLTLFLMGIALSLKAQLPDQTVEFYQQRVRENIGLLIKDSLLYNNVEVDDKGISLYAVGEGTRPEFTLYWDEIPHFLRLLYNMDYYETLELYNEKGNSPYYLDDIVYFLSHTLNPPTQFNGLKVAIDPGHFAASWQQALQEERYLKIRGEDLGLDKDLRLYEADLTYGTALLLKDSLEKLGAEVLITRQPGESAVGKGFSEWYETDFEVDLARHVASGDISPGMAAKIKESDNKKFIFETFYKYLDFIGRGRRINEFAPDLTLVLHYNVDEDNHRDARLYTKPTRENYSMAFIPGSFLRGELKKQDARIDFLRLLVSYDLDESYRLAKTIMDNIENDLGVPAIPKENDLIHAAKYDILTDRQGVYCRNLYLTRAVKGPVVYLEALYQDNIDELKMLSNKKIRIGDYRTSTRCKQVSDALMKSIDAWLLENKGLPFIE